MRTNAIKLGGMRMSRIISKLNKKNNYFFIAVILFWLKTYAAYLVEFNLGVTGLLQHILLFINPLPFIIIFFSISLYFKRKKVSHYSLLIIQLALSFLLYSNILYYREFTDFLTMNIMMGSNNVSGAMLTSTIAMIRSWDLLYWVDVLLLFFLIKKAPSSTTDVEEAANVSTKTNSRFKFLTTNKTHKGKAFMITQFGVLLFIGNLLLAEIDRPQLLTRTFDRNFIVKYLGINFFTGYDVVHTIQTNSIRANADESHLSKAVTYAKQNHAAPNAEYFGIAEDRNVIMISMESIQQFLIDFELEDEYGRKHEVMPFVNSLFHSEASYSYENFFHQTGQGKSADAEVLAELSLYGLPQGSAFQTLGSSNTFHATPNILKSAGYTTAAFHGNVGSFWNRTDTYGRFGYDYFFDSEFYDLSEDRAMEYGLKDKLFFHDSVEYMEQLPQPFYSKFITVTHHFPYPIDEANEGFPKAQTDDETINNFFVTANYADQAIEEFFNYLKASGLYDNSMIVLYGDHFGISNMRNPHVAPLLGQDPEEWGNYENTHMQRVPLIIHIPGETNGQVFDTFSGQVDMLPTMMHLLGLETDQYLFMGQDLLSEEHDGTVTLRNGRVINKDYTFIEQSVYDTKTGNEIHEDLSPVELNALYKQRDRARQAMSYSDEIMQMDLLRFYTPESLTVTEPIDYLYRDQLQILKRDNRRETSLIEKNGGVSTIELYETDAPEMMNTDMDEEEMGHPNHTETPKGIERIE